MMKAHYDRVANSMGFQEDHHVRLYRPTWTRGKSFKLQPSWEGPYKVITQISNIDYRFWQHPRVKTVVHLDILATYLGATWDEQP
jgi:hypothetical protein